MTAAHWAAVVVWAVLMLTVLVICADSKRREADARAKHPSNWLPPGVGLFEPPRYDDLPVVHVVDVPLVCPVCLTPFAYGHLSEFGGTIGGWINLQKHECVKARTA